MGFLETIATIFLSLLTLGIICLAVYAMFVLCMVGLAMSSYTKEKYKGAKKMTILDKMYISRDCYEKINKETGKVDCAAFRDTKKLGVSEFDTELGASTIQMFHDDVPILIDPTRAYDIDEETDDYDGTPYKIYWFKDGVEAKIL